MISKSKALWEFGGLGGYESPRPKEAEVFSYKGSTPQSSKITYTYTPNYNRVASQKEYGYAGELIRNTVTTYKHTTDYTGAMANFSGGSFWQWENYVANSYCPYWNGPHIFTLVAEVWVCPSATCTGNMREGATHYRYDEYGGTYPAMVIRPQPDRKSVV